MLKGAESLVGASLYRGCTIDGLRAEADHHGYKDGLAGIDRAAKLPREIREDYVRGHIKAAAKIPTR